MGVDELSCLPVRKILANACVWIDQLDVDQTLGREVHPRLSGAFAPERGRDVADSHDFVDPRTKGALQLAAERVLAAAGLAADDDPLDWGEADAFGPRHLGDVQRVRRRAGERLRLQPLDRREELLGIADADRDMDRADRFECRERGPGDEWACAIGRHDTLAGLQAVSRIRAPPDLAPLLDVVRGERNVERLLALSAGGRYAR